MLHDSLPFKRNLYTEFQPTMIYMPKNGLIFCKTIIFKIHFVIQDLASQVEINTTGSFLKFNFRENCKITDLTLFSQWLYHFFLMSVTIKPLQPCSITSLISFNTNPSSSFTQIHSVFLSPLLIPGRYFCQWYLG